MIRPENDSPQSSYPDSEFHLRRSDYFRNVLILSELHRSILYPQELFEGQRLSTPFEQYIRYFGEQSTEGLLEQVWQQRDSHPVVLVIGPVGVGKSTFLHRLVKVLAGHNFAVVNFENAQEIARNIREPNRERPLVNPEHLSGQFDINDYWHATIIFLKAIRIARERHQFVFAEVMATTREYINQTINASVPERGQRALLHLGNDRGIPTFTVALAAGEAQMAYSRAVRSQLAFDPNRAARGTPLGGMQSDNDLIRYLHLRYPEFSEYRPDIFSHPELRKRFMLSIYYPELLYVDAHLPPARTLICENEHTDDFSVDIAGEQVIAEHSFLKQLSPEEMRRYLGI